ncbi:hypothetical protein FE782_15615 [Paenibacillus antri]|uniref:Uncharacterized protein n=1 Tax=Paenibacillus antri TaxID=2582848 RepID=A0A5R9GER3_9BACL|nr:hypothetical protein [Paenibacillus antri]TLS51163.1 hypothetical protein FE782_15615 [Paenibacillus antri]
MRDYPTLKALDAFRGLFALAGVNYPVMRRILQAKLTMDRRRSPTAFSQYNAKADDGRDRNVLAGALWLYALMGLIMVPFVILGDAFWFQMSLVFGIFLFFASTAMISDFSSVLLDVRDRNVLGTKPIDRRTIGAAKAVHVFLYLATVTSALIAGPLVAGTIKHGPGFAALFLAAVALIDLAVVAATAMLYAALLRWFDGERLKDTINYVQIALSIAITAGYQVLARSFGLVDLQAGFEPSPWHLLLPPLWFAAPFELLLRGATGTVAAAGAILALAVPIAAIALYARMAPAFERSLVKLASHGGKPRRSGSRRMSGRLAGLLCASREEQAFFRFASSMLTAEREFKLKVYPSLGFALVFPFIFLFQGLADMSLAEMAGTRWHLSIYLGGIMIPSVLYMLKYSGAYKGAWIFRVAPSADRSAMYRGTVKAALARLLAPVTLLLGVAYFAIFGVGFAPHFAAVALGFCLYAALCFLFSKKTPPFSESFVGAKGGGIEMIALMLLLVVFFLLHLASTYAVWGVWAYIALLLLANRYVWRTAFRVS